MPLYEYACDKCGFIKEVLLPEWRRSYPCPKCGRKMRKIPSYPAMVKIKGSGGYPSRRKMIKGTAPYSG